MSDPQSPDAPAPGTAVTASARKMQLDQVVAAPRMGGGVTFLPRTMQECLDFATIMSKSDFAIPPLFRGNPGACLAVTIQACRWEADPFGVIQKAYITKSKDGSERLAYEAQLVAAVVNTRAGLAGKLKLVYTGDGLNRKVKVIGTFAATGEEREIETPTVGKAKRHSPLWESDPDQQLAYYGMRAWGRRWVPEVLLGIYTPEEFEDEPRIDAPRPTRPAQVIEGPQNAEEGIVRRAEPEPPVEAKEVIAQVAALEPKPDDTILEDNQVVTNAAPITQNEAERLDDMRDPPLDEDEGPSESFTRWEEFLVKAKEGLMSADLQNEADLDDYAKRTKGALAEADGLSDDEKDDLRARFVSAYLKRKKAVFVTTGSRRTR